MEFERCIVTEVLPNATFRVRLPNDAVILATISGRLRQNYIRILQGDFVRVAVSPYDLTRGRITWREKVKIGDQQEFSNVSASESLNGPIEQNLNSPALATQNFNIVEAQGNDVNENGNLSRPWDSNVGSSNVENMVSGNGKRRKSKKRRKKK